MATDFSQALPSFSGLKVRLPEDGDGPFPGHSQAWPLIVTPGLSQPTPDSLRQVLAENSNAVMDALSDFSAILFRGFGIRSEKEFESTILSIPGIQAMRSWLLPEPGRDRVDPTTNAFHTNTLLRAENLAPPLFHSENYLLWDIPTIQSFWCKKASRIGGETGFVHMPSVYDELPAEVRARLEAEPVFAAAHRLSTIARQYGTSEAVVERFLNTLNIPIEDSAGEKYALVYKPCVWRHPDNKRLSLQAVLANEIEGLFDAFVRLIAPHYKGRRWVIHRFFWRHRAILGAAMVLATTFRHPVRIIQSASSLSPSKIDKPRVGDKIDDVAALAAAMWRHTSVLTWNEGDVVLFDNRQLVHSRMPGFGKRALRALLCNSVLMDGRPNSGVFETPRTGLWDETLDVRLTRFVNLDKAGAVGRGGERRGPAAHATTAAPPNSPPR